MSEETEEQFLREGIKRYAPALDTIRAFETMMKARLSRVAKDYTFSGFTPLHEPIVTGTTVSTGAHWIWAAQPRTIQSNKGRVSLELGMAWKEEDVAYYCNLLDADSNVINFSYDRKHPRVEPRKWSKKARLFMLVSMNADAELDAEFRILLDELLASFK